MKILYPPWRSFRDAYLLFKEMLKLVKKMVFFIFSFDASYIRDPLHSLFCQLLLHVEFEMYDCCYCLESPFEFRALEVALEAICSLLAARTTELETSAYPALDELTLKVYVTSYFLVVIYCPH